jgi:hypothetical protein
MAESVEEKIADLLLAHLAELPISPMLPVAWPGIAFTPPAGTYLEADLIPNTNVNRFVSDDSEIEYRGILQVTVSAPSGGGIVAAIELAGAIADHFERDTTLSDGEVRVRVSGRPNLASPQQEPDRIRIPVSINYYAFA